VTKHAVRLAAKYAKQKRVTSVCADGITATLNDLVSRATGLRAELASGS
jgi:hypothetical protein